MQTVCLKGLWDKISHAHNVTEGAVGCVCAHIRVYSTVCVHLKIHSCEHVYKSVHSNTLSDQCISAHMKDGDTVFSVSANQSSSCAVVIPLLQSWH